jgi:DDE_Tnp_1-associated
MAAAASLRRLDEPTTAVRPEKAEVGYGSADASKGASGVLGVAVLAGARSLAAIGEWAADAPGPILAALGLRRNPLTGAWRPPPEATVRRMLARVDPDALDRTIGAWLAAQKPPPPANRNCCVHHGRPRAARLPA